MKALPLFRTLADIEAFEAVPLEQRMSGMQSAYDVILRSAQRKPEATALVFMPDGDPDTPAVEINYRTFAHSATQAANAFHALGIGSDDVVSYLLPNLPQTHFVLWGAMAAGIVNPINPLLEAEHLVQICQAAGTRVLVTLAPEQAPDLWSKVSSLISRVPDLKAVVCVGAVDAVPTSEFSPIHSFEALVAAQPGDRLVGSRRAGRADMAAYLHTGGTTGIPKIARLTHLNLLANAVGTDLREPGEEQDTVLCGLPLFHVNGVMLTGLMPFAAGDRVVLMSPNGYRNKSVIDNIWRIVERYQATHISGVPTLYAALLNVPTAGADISSLRYAVCGAAPMPPELMRNFERTTGVPVLEGYGLTEGACVSSANPRDGERRVGSIGLRQPYQEMKVVRRDERGAWSGDCAFDEVGHVLIKGPNIFAGYKRDIDNEGVWLADGWFDTGDLGRQDHDGYFWLTGRQKELIIRGGHNLDPALIEDALARHPAVQIAAAVGKPDAYAGELPVAYVVLRAGVKIDTSELQEFARASITERAAVPNEIFVVDNLPLTAVGKVFKPALRFDSARRVLTGVLEAACSGLAKIDVEVGAHPVHGQFATVKLSQVEDVKAARDAVDAALSPYSIRYSVSIT
ncbi:acyl-CoA synthetase [Burkholderia sp. BCC1977]|uniref:acyl-CoA synthetase n=1 Tax=Burkholderia sp. BCC1977 TaxID=2817440 RepID=UPI002ABD1D46|nr:acyl-CoA synthetase [Burkholderia sp. BCC1977]